jgi:hypothetical protein
MAVRDSQRIVRMLQMPTVVNMFAVPLQSAQEAADSVFVVDGASGVIDVRPRSASPAPAPAKPRRLRKKKQQQSSGSVDKERVYPRATRSRRVLDASLGGAAAVVSDSDSSIDDDMHFG